jgi:hypothetical protein
VAKVSVQSQVTLEAGPQQQTLTAPAGEDFIVLELESLTGQDLFSLFVQNGADLTQVYLEGQDGQEHAALHFSGIGVPAERFTIIFYAFPVAQAGSIDFHFLDARSVPLAEFPALAPAAALPAGEPFYIFPFCNCEHEVPSGMVPTLRWAWVTATEAYLQDYIDALRITVSIDGEAHAGLEGYWGEMLYSGEDGGFKSVWIYPLPALSSGFHDVETSLWLDHGLTDGFDMDGDGQPDMYGPGQDAFGWVGLLMAEDYGSAAVCPNGAPADHWALIVNKASSSDGTIGIDGKQVNIHGGENVIYLTADVPHPILVGSNTINLSAPECGENTLEVP